MVPFSLVLEMVMALSAREPTYGRQAPRSFALEISRVAADVREAALLADTAWEESRFVPNAVGDHGRALCGYQLQHAPTRVLVDLRLCTELGLERLRQSAALCPRHPLAYYLSGRCDAALAASDRRLADAADLEVMSLP